MWCVILVSLRSENHIFHNYHTMIENDTLINEDGAHKVFLLILRNVSMKLLKRED